MKYIRSILTIIIGLITILLIWTYIQRAQLNYNAEGRFFSSEEGIIYHEQTKDIYAILALFGLLATGILIVKLITIRKEL